MGAKVLENESSRERKFQWANGPRSELAREQKGQEQIGSGPMSSVGRVTMWVCVCWAQSVCSCCIWRINAVFLQSLLELQSENEQSNHNFI